MDEDSEVKRKRRKGAGRDDVIYLVSVTPSWPRICVLPPRTFIQVKVDTKPASCCSYLSPSSLSRSPPWTPRPTNANMPT